MKFIHTGDLHLGYKFSSSYSEETLKILKENQKKLIKDIITLANDKKVDYIFIAGDLFDTKNPDDELYTLVTEEFKKTDGKIFISAGNHDPYTPDSVYLKPFPENTVIFPGEITSYSFDDCDIYGYSFVNSHKADNSFSGFKVKDENNISIMVAHGDLVADSFYNPIMPSDIEKSGLDYMALGHIHISDGLKRAGKTLYGYSGTPLSMTFKETEENSVIFGEINGGVVKTEKINIASHFFK
jgi:DNA repair exonuclease SbcCD nuclease subunit